METIINLPFNFSPRDYQTPIFEAFDEGYKRIFIYAHRKAGKDLVCWQIIVRDAIENKGNYLYVLPDKVQGRATIWDSIDPLTGNKFLDYIPQQLIADINISMMKITLFNGSTIQVTGASEPDSLRGPNPRGVVFSEACYMNWNAWGVIRPILTLNGGWAIFNSTPNGPCDADDLYEIAKTSPEWKTFFLTINDTHILTKADVDKEISQGMDKQLAEQEYYISRKGVVSGSYYAAIVEELERTGHIKSNIYDTSLPVEVSFDIGRNDTTALWFFQRTKFDRRYIRCYENSGKDLSHYAGIILDYRTKYNYKYSQLIYPHDIKVTDLSREDNKSRYDVMKGLLPGIPTNIVESPPGSVQEGIDIVRRELLKSYFDPEGCNEGLKALRVYHKSYDQKRQVYLDHPYHDKNSNYADSFRYSCVANTPVVKKQHISMLKTRSGKPWV